MSRTLSLLLVLSLAAAARAATITVDVRDARGGAVADAVVYAVPEGRELPLVKKSAIMDQKNRTFVPHVLPVQTGTAVRFPNSDDIRHQVYSFSSVKQFQIPLYKGTPANPVVFDRAGVVTLGCSIHDRMSAYIVIVDTPYFATTKKNGRAELEAVNAGKYALRVWYPEMANEPAPTALALGSADNERVVVTVRK
ncbi:MAG TPA: methylamine utilization protein [Vicinamibacterales bacterium]|jgi:plastocyanin